MDPRTYFKPYLFMNRLNKYAVNAYYVDLIKKEANLREILIQARITDSKKSIVNFFSDPEVLLAVATEKDKQQKIENIIFETNKKQVEEVDKFFIILMNQTLVMLCTIFDTFLVDCFDVITYTRPNFFSNKKHVLINRDKMVNKFDYAGIKDKFKYLTMTGLEMGKLFSLNSIMGPKYSDPLKILHNAYDNRNDVIHRNQMKISSYNEIASIADFMMHLIIRWGTLDFKKHFDIQSDFRLIYNGELQPTE